MTLRTKLFTSFLIGATAYCSAQMSRYNYKSNLNEISEEWHKLTIPHRVFGKLNPDFSDLRIYGITAKNDTVEAPYFLKELSEKTVHKAIPFDIINTTKNGSDYYFTFQLNADETINQIKLNFKEENFDWAIELQGSQNQQEWYTILEDYRILSIKNASTNFKFTTLEFPEAKYKFYRLLINHTTPPQLESAKLSKHHITEGTFTNYAINRFETIDHKQEKTTTINFDLDMPVPISQVKIDISDTFDYYRPFKIEYKKDSVKTENGWKYHYQTLTSGTLNSLEDNRFKFPSTIAKHLRITVFNGDNQPLTISHVAVKGYDFEMIARFSVTSNYVLVYGHPSARKPNYDIERFRSKVPKDLKALQIGEEQAIIKPQPQKVKPLFESNYWLWGVIAAVILLLGGFTLKMLRKV